MTTSAILFGTSMALLVLYFITRPFRILHGRNDSVDSKSNRLNLMIRKISIYTAIHEIDSDVAVGKLEVADHQVLRRRYVAEGAAILKALDALPAGDYVDNAIEKDISRLRDGQQVSDRVCPICSAPVESNDQFCAACGARLGGTNHAE